MAIHPKHIIVSRPDSIGDVMLTLSMCGLLKHQFPNVKISFLGKSYTQAVIEACKHVDTFLNWDEIEKTSTENQVDTLVNAGADVIIHVFPKKEIIWLAKKARIPYRIATGGRWHTITKCNRPVFFSRRKSDLHESQLNVKLLSPLGITTIPSLSVLNDYSGFQPNNHSVDYIAKLAVPSPYVILHPLSKGSAVNWSLSRFEELAKLLLENGLTPVITGTAAEGDRIRANSTLLQNNGVIDATGKLTLAELILFINDAHALVAASTGPLHIASQLNKPCVGLYTPLRPMHAGRWAPIGQRAQVITAAEHPDSGELDIPAAQVLGLILAAQKS